MSERLQNLDSYTSHLVVERELVYSEILTNLDVPPSELRFLEIGAGHGFNVYYMKELGVRESNITLVEPDDERFEELQKSFETARLYHGGFDQAELDEPFDVILVSLVMSSVLEDDQRQSLLETSLRLLKANGHLIIYDFKYDNPRNKNVRGVKPEWIRSRIGDGWKIQQCSVTLAPPIGRRVGPLYKLLNLLPLLRSHFILDIYSLNTDL